MRAIISKELRELMRLLPVGIILIGLAVIFSLPSQNGWQGSGLVPTCSAIFAVLLAAMQGFFDLSDRQSGFLFHRSVSRAKIMYGKVLAALIVYLIAVAVPLSFMALYFASVGLEYIPVDPIQILPTLLLCFASFAMHPAALLTIDREASWFGTRLLPLPIAIISLVMLTAFTLSAKSSLMQVVVLLLFLVVLSFLLLGLQRGHFARKIILAVGAVSTVIIAIFFGASLVQSLTVQAQYHTIEYGIDNQGDLWVYKSRFDYSENGYVSIRVPISGYRMQSNAEPNIKGPLPENFEPYALTWLCRLDDSPRQHRYQYSGYTGRKYLVSAPNGIVLVYDWNSTPPLQGAISRSGFHSSVDVVSEPFEGDALIAGTTASTPLVAAGYEPLWIDRAGVYQFDRDRGLITTLVELPIESTSVMIAGDKNATEKKVVRLFVQTDTDAHVFTLIDSAGATNWLSDDSESRSRALPQLQAVKERTVPKLPSLPSELGSRAPMIGSTADGGLVAVSVYGNYRRAVLANEPNATWELDQIVPPTESVNALPRVGTVCMISLIPPIVLLILGISALVISAVNNLPPPPMLGLPNETLFVALSVGVTATLCSVALVWVLGRRRGFSSSTQLAWGLATLLSGVASPLILLALHPRMPCEPCPRCERQRRINRNTCPHCGNEWESIQSEGIEIIDFDVRGQVARRDDSRSRATL